MLGIGQALRILETFRMPHGWKGGRKVEDKRIGEVDTLLASSGAWLHTGEVKSYKKSLDKGDSEESTTTSQTKRQSWGRDRSGTPRNRSQC